MIGRRSTRTVVLAAAFLAVMSGGAASHADVTLPALISNNMVLQRDTQVAIWGWAQPGERVRVQAEWAEAGVETVSDDRGHWRVYVDTPGAGGPYALTVAGDTVSKLENIMIGEVWLCSGQSNMEWPVSASLRAESEIASARFPTIRLFTVPNRKSLHQRIDCRAEWLECAPETAAGFSAVGYFFGRRLHEELDVPIGLISADWGGTVIEAWMSESAISTFSEFDDTLQIVRALRDPNRRGDLVQEMNRRWWDGLDDLGPDAPGDAWAGTGYVDGDWGTMRLPATWEQDGLDEFDGIIRFRRTIELPASWDGRPAVLELGPIDDRDDAWVNGVHVGSTREAGRWNDPRQYDVARGVLQAGANVIAVRAFDTGGLGGINGRPEQMVLTPADESGPEPISLSGEWRYLVGTPASKLPPLPSTVGLGPNTPTVLFNGMIAPLIPFGMRGVIWYQGESNRLRPAQYQELFPALIGQWRGDWGLGDFPFYFVQIAPFRYGGDRGEAAALREAQAMTQRTPGTGMVVTTDIGNPHDIHPRNKQEVGRRLALWALAGTYGQPDLVHSGPIYGSMTVEGSSIRIAFDHVGGGLECRGAALTHFQIAGRDRQFIEAAAVIDGNSVVVSSPDVPEPIAVRFAWEAAPEPNLFNAEGLPASPFRTDTWPRDDRAVESESGPR
jgi:sialate O-acetylesterase